jgi:hypothetical protein
MMKAHTTLFLLTAIIATAQIALSQAMHDIPPQAPSRQVAGAPSQHVCRSPYEDRARRSLFEICQHQDPTTPALRVGTSECFALPY